VEHVRGRYDERITAATPEEGLVGRAIAEKAILRDDETVAVPSRAPGRHRRARHHRPPAASSPTPLSRHRGQLSAAYEVARLRDDSARRNKDLQTAIAGLKASSRAATSCSATSRTT
jgi:hypothetical protein